MATPVILLVDDTKLFLKLEQEYLKTSSVIVLTAGNGREALEIVRTRRPDLIYMDLNMPEMNGLVCCATLKADPEFCTIPVVLVTTEGESVEQCKNAGCNGFLTKPIERRAFLAMGRSFLPSIDRRERRIPCKVKVLFKVGEREPMQGTCIDLSSRGMYIACSAELELDEKVEITMLVSGHSDSLVEAWGRVAWLNFNGARRKKLLPEGFGIEFLSITEESLRLVRNFLTHGTTLPGFNSRIIRQEG